MLVHRLEAAAVRLALPGVCGLCGGEAQWDRCRAGLDLCEHCEAALPARAAPDRLTVAGCDVEVIAAFDYRPPADSMVRLLKFAGDRSFARTLGLLMAERRMAHRSPLADVLVPVPLHGSRHRDRGFNQAEELARFMGRAMRVPVQRWLLRRVRATQAQSGLAAAARVANVYGAFVLEPGRAGVIVDRRVAVIDDVLTTGSTATEVVRVLQDAGAAAVEICVACQAGALGTQ